MGTGTLTAAALASSDATPETTHDPTLPRPQETQDFAVLGDCSTKGCDTFSARNPRSRTGSCGVVAWSMAGAGLTNQTVACGCYGTSNIIIGNAEGADRLELRRHVPQLR